MTTLTRCRDVPEVAAGAWALVGAAVFDGETLRERATLCLRDGVVEAIMSPDADLVGYTVQRFDGGIITPGLIDLQVNGGGGVLLNNDPTPDGVRRIIDAHRRLGTIGIMPTLISDSDAVREKAVDAVAIVAAENPNVLGVHLEGPHIAPTKRGVHCEEHARPLGKDDVAFLQRAAERVRVMVTLAPECASPGAIAALVKAGVIVCAGHTNATYEEMSAAFDAGVTGVTHLYNAMSPFQSRAPGAVGAALDCPEVWCGVIADGHHVHPAAMRLALRAKPAGKVFLVSDAMASVGSDASSFRLYGEDVHVERGRLVNEEGRLAGAHVSLGECARRCEELAGWPLTETLRMASLYPAQFLGLDDEWGRIGPGQRARLTYVPPNERSA